MLRRPHENGVLQQGVVEANEITIQPDFEPGSGI